ncbi:MAG: LamG domain-containing protein, partial [Verrucomicrobia bacterium]|nr:LamG domain-containing protein [Verrucomicrobiota bacterium]
MKTLDHRAVGIRSLACKFFSLGLIFSIGLFGVEGHALSSKAHIPVIDENHFAHFSGDGHFAELTLEQLDAWESFGIAFWVRWELLGRASTPFLIRNDPVTPAMMGFNSGWYGSGFQFFCQNNQSQLLASSYPDSLLSHEWMHIALVVDGSRYLVFVNGLEVDVRDYSDSQAFAGGLLAQVFRDGLPKIFLGIQDHPDNQQFVGDLDDLILFSWAPGIDTIRETMWRPHHLVNQPQPGYFFWEDFENFSNGSTGQPGVRFTCPPPICKGSKPESYQDMKSGFIWARFVLPDSADPDTSLYHVQLFKDGSHEVSMVPPVRRVPGAFEILLPVEKFCWSLKAYNKDSIYSGGLLPSVRNQDEVALREHAGQKIQVVVEPEIEDLKHQWTLEYVSRSTNPLLPDTTEFFTSNPEGEFEPILLHPEHSQLTLHTVNKSIPLPLDPQLD